MADSSARRIEFEPNRQVKSEKVSRIVINPRQERWTGLERTLVVIGSAVTLGMMTFLVSSSISATSAQYNLSNVEHSINKKQNEITSLNQEIGELTSNSRLKRIARSKGLTLNDKNIRTIR